MIIDSSQREYDNKIYIKRVQIDGQYEPEWFDVSKYVVSVGDYEENYGDNIFTGDYDTTEFDVIFNNIDRSFSSHGTSESLFFGYRSQYNTRVKRDINIRNEDGTTTTLRSIYGVLLEEPTIKNNGEATFNFSSVDAVFKKYPARFRNYYDSDNTGEITTPVIDEIPVMRERNGGDAIGIFMFFSNGGLGDPSQTIFLRYFEGDLTNFFTFPSELPETNIEVTRQANTDPIENTPFLTNRMHIYLSNMEEDSTVFDEIVRILGATFTYMTVNDSGNLEFKIKDFNGEVQHKIIGNNGGSTERTNVVEIEQENTTGEIYNRVIINYKDGTHHEDSNFTLDDNTTGSEYGVKAVEFDMPYLTQNGAVEFAQNLLPKVSRRRRKFIIKTKFDPRIKVGDIVELTVTGESYGELIGEGFIIGEAIIGATTGSLVLEKVKAIVSSNLINEYEFTQKLEVITV